MYFRLMQRRHENSLHNHNTDYKWLGKRESNQKSSAWQFSEELLEVTRFTGEWFAFPAEILEKGKFHVLGD
jgi:hypothetical protein